MARPAHRPVLAGIAWMALAMSCISVVDAFAKQLSHSLNGVQVAWGYFVGMLVNLSVYVLLARTPLRAVIRTRRPALQLARAATLVMSLSCLFFSLRFLPLAEATTISFTSPLFIVILAGPLLAERVGWERWAAALVGLAGAALVVRPGAAVFQWAALLPLAGAFAFSLFSIATRAIAGADPPLTSIFYTFLGGAVLLSTAMPFVWTTPTLAQTLLLFALGALGLVAHFSMVRALLLADASTLAPLSYLRLVWAIALGLVLFDQAPDAFTLAGGAVIIGSGLYVVYGRFRARG